MGSAWDGASLGLGLLGGGLPAESIAAPVTPVAPPRAGRGSRRLQRRMATPTW